MPGMEKAKLEIYIVDVVQNRYVHIYFLKKFILNIWHDPGCERTCT